METDGRAQLVKQLFQEAAELSGEDRERLLTERCGGDSGLRSAVEALLGADAGAGDRFLEGAPPTTGGAMPQRVGQYEIVRRIAEGGMGAVFEAMQQHPRRPVALKLLKAGLLSSDALRRFEYETQVLASLRHPGIAQIYEAGTQSIGGIYVPYFAMELIEGAKPITQFARDQRLDIRRRLALFVEVCEAVHHGHQRGVIHRDLKPSNILVGASEPGASEPVARATGRSLACATGSDIGSKIGSDVGAIVKVIDFGVARSVGEPGSTAVTMATSTGQIIGTLPYMSPEQCGGTTAHDIDVRSDVYSLGVVLYELLCERLPYDVERAEVLEAARIIREQPPTRPSAVIGWHGRPARNLRGDLETIVLKALEKDRARRYQSADELARDIRHYLSNEPIEARRDSTLYLLRKAVARHRAAFAVLLGFIGLIVGTSIVAWSLTLRATRAEAQARGEAESAKQISDFYAGLLLNMDPWSEGAFKAGAKPSDIRLPDLLREAVRRIPASFKDRPDLAAGLQRNIGRAFNGLASPEEAERIFRESYEAARQALGENDPATLELQRNLGNSLHGRYAYDEGIRVLKDTVDRTVRVLGEDHAQSLLALMSLNWPMRKNEDIKESDRLSLRVVAIAQRTLREDDPLLIEALSQRAYILYYHHRPVEAEPVARRAVHAARPIASGRSIYLAFALDALGTSLMAQGRWANALAVFQESIEIRRIIEGENHSDCLSSSRCAVTLLARLGRCDEAVARARKLNDLAASMFDVRHPESVDCLEELGFVLVLCGKSSEAERSARERLEQLTGTTLLESIFRRQIGMVLALAIESQGRTAEAEAIATQVLRHEKTPEALKSIDFWYHEFYPLVGRCLARLGEYAEAEWRLLDAHRRLAVEGITSEARDQQVIADLVTLYGAWGKPDKAGEWRANLALGRATSQPATRQAGTSRGN